MIDALTESYGHAILTVLLMLATVLGLAFVILYARTDWFANTYGRLTMGNMGAWTVIAAGGLFYRLGWQVSALTLLIPIGIVVVTVQTCWVVLLVRSLMHATDWRVQILVGELETLAAQLAKDGHMEQAECVFKYSRILQDRRSSA